MVIFVGVSCGLQWGAVDIKVLIKGNLVPGQTHGLWRVLGGELPTFISGLGNLCTISCHYVIDYSFPPVGRLFPEGAPIELQIYLAKQPRETDHLRPSSNYSTRMNHFRARHFVILRFAGFCHSNGFLLLHIGKRQPNYAQGDE